MMVEIVIYSRLCLVVELLNCDVSLFFLQCYVANTLTQCGVAIRGPSLPFFMRNQIWTFAVKIPANGPPKWHAARV